MVTSTVPAGSAGVMAVMRLSDRTVEACAGTAPNSTWVAMESPAPSILTGLPPRVGPEVGLSAFTTGGEQTVATSGCTSLPLGVHQTMAPAAQTLPRLTMSSR